MLSPAASRSRELSTASLTASTSRSISGATSSAGDVPTREPYRHPGGTMGRVTGSSPRHHADRCPGVLRPWIADDGALVRIRLVGGAISAQALSDLAVIAGDHADGHLYLTKRANIQLRGIKHVDGSVPEEFVEAVRAAGLLPSPSHELVRNIMVSPLRGRIGGHADLRQVGYRLDDLLRDDPAC